MAFNQAKKAFVQVFMRYLDTIVDDLGREKDAEGNTLASETNHLQEGAACVNPLLV